MATNTFMTKLANQLVERKGVSRATSLIYVNKLYRLNETRAFKNLNWLDNYSAIDEKLAKYAKTTRVSYYIAIVSSLFANKGPDSRLYKFYSKRMNAAHEQAMSTANIRSDKQLANWLSWDDIIERRELLRVHFRNIAIPYTAAEFKIAQQYLLLSVLTMIPPRRNLDWIKMKVVRRWLPRMSKQFNYYSIEDKQFIFNTYKTVAKYGVQKIDAPDNLAEMIGEWLEMRPDFRPRQAKTKMLPLIVNKKMEPFKTSGAMTRMLNTIFGGKVSTTMLRSVYLTSKYGAKEREQEADAAAMAHSTAVQRSTYIKRDVPLEAEGGGGGDGGDGEDA